MEATYPPRAPVLHVGPPLDHDSGLRLVDVDGALEGSAIKRWGALLRGATNHGARGLAVDLRGCELIDGACLSALVDAAADLKDQGGGVTVVVFPGSKLAHRLQQLVGGGLPVYDTATAAILALGKLH